MRELERILVFKGLVILREFDHGASADFWLVPMSGEELEKWWSSQETFNDNPPELQETAQIYLISSTKHASQKRFGA